MIIMVSAADVYITSDILPVSSQYSAIDSKRLAVVNEMKT